MSQDLVGLAGALRWARPGSSGWADCEASWGGSGRDVQSPGYSANLENVFALCS